MAGPRIASLCTGYGGLDDAVQQTYGGQVVWVADNDPGAAEILAHNHLDVPNLGDITTVDWQHVLDQYGPVDIATMGFPCQDVSVAGHRAGLLDGNRSGLWRHCARAIAVLRPSLAVIENVPGLLSFRADGDVEPCPWCLGDGGGEPPVRALGAVLADLADLGFDAEWTCVAASEVGACHQRRRVFIVAWPADASGPGLEDGREGRLARGGADASDAQGVGRGEGRTEPARQQGRLGAVGGGGASAADSADVGRERGGQHGDGGPDLRTAIAAVAADTDSEPRDERWESASGETPGGRPSAVDCGCDRAPWGRYAPAIHRWETVTGRPAPAPVDERGRLAPVFVEWMQGAAGRVTGVPGLSRKAMLKALGNGVVSLQAAAAIDVLHHRMPVAARLSLAEHLEAAA